MGACTSSVDRPAGIAEQTLLAQFKDWLHSVAKRGYFAGHACLHMMCIDAVTTKPRPRHTVSPAPANQLVRLWTHTWRSSASQVQTVASSLDESTEEAAQTYFPMFVRHLMVREVQSGIESFQRQCETLGVTCQLLEVTEQSGGGDAPTVPAFALHQSHVVFRVHWFTPISEANRIARQHCIQRIVDMLKTQRCDRSFLLPSDMTDELLPSELQTQGCEKWCPKVERSSLCAHASVVSFCAASSVKEAWVAAASRV